MIFLEPLDESEIRFVTLKYEKASKDYLRIMNLFLISCGIFPVLIGFTFGLIANDVDVFVQVFIISLISLIIFFVVVAGIYYFLFLFNKYRDASQKTKIIEPCLVLEKKSMPLNNTFHVYIDSRIRYSIEVSEPDFNHFEVGDEINIEYTAFDKEYLGYY